MNGNKGATFSFLIAVVIALFIFHDTISFIASSIPSWIYFLLVVFQTGWGVVLIRISKDKFGDVIGTILLFGGVIEFVYLIV